MHQTISEIFILVLRSVLYTRQVTRSNETPPQQNKNKQNTTRNNKQTNKNTQHKTTNKQNHKNINNRTTGTIILAKVVVRLIRK